MAHMRGEYGNQMQQSDEYGNQMQQSDEYGNPMQPKGHTTGPGKYGQHQGAMGGSGGGGGGTPDMSMGSYHQETKGGGGNEYDGISTGQYGSGQHGMMAGSDMHGGGAMGGSDMHGGVLQRSGSHSSSSSEDDGEGGRRKKGNRKERLPGGRRGDDSCYNQTEGGGATARPGGYDMGEGYQEETQEKKGIMEKIKEKLPGRH